MRNYKPLFKQICAVALSSLFCLSFTGCAKKAEEADKTGTPDEAFFDGYGTVADEGRTEPVYTEAVTVSSLKTAGGKTYLEVEGEPFLYLGASIRTDAFMNCDHYKYADIEKLFSEAKELGVTCVQVPVEWKDIEPVKDEYDFSYVHAVLTFLNRYGLKGELLWFGSNMCGESHSYSVPEYILCDGKTYPKLDAKRTGEYWSYYGIMWYLDFDNENLLARESAAAKAMMEYVWEWDSTHGGKKPVIGVQVNNEVDNFARFRINSSQSHTYVIDPETNALITYEKAMRKAAKNIDEIGKAVKSSKYKVFTRANLAASTQGAVYTGGGRGRSDVREMPDFARQFLALDGIDAVGDDPYLENVESIKGIAYMYGGKSDGNFSHIAENAGNYACTPSLILAAFSAGAGYSVYDLATSPLFIRDAESDGDQGILRVKEDGTFEKRAHYELTRKVIAGLKGIGAPAAIAGTDDFAVFNLSSSAVPPSTCDKTVLTTDVSFRFETTDGALGAAVVQDGKIYLFSTAEASFTIEGVTLSGATKNGSAVTGNRITLTAGDVFAASYTGSGNYTANVWENI